MPEREPTRDEYRDAIDGLCGRLGRTLNDLASGDDAAKAAYHRLRNGDYKRAAPTDDSVQQMASAFGFRSAAQFKRYCITPQFNGAIGVADCIEVGSLQTLWFRQVGSGERGQELKDANVELVFAEREPNFGSTAIERAIANTRNSIVGDKFTAGGASHENGRLFALQTMSSWPPRGPAEERVLRLGMGVIDYAAFWTLLNDSKAKHARMERLRDWSPSRGFDPLFGLGLGINVAIFTKDEKMIFGVRSMGQGARCDEIDVGAVEGMSVKKDGTSNLVLKDVAYRAVEEEYFITRDVISEMHILGFGFDMQYCQWNGIAVCYTSLNAADLRRRQKIWAEDVAEFSGIFAVVSEPDAVARWLAAQDRRIWSCGIASAVYGLTHKYGKSAVSAAFDDFSSARPEQYDLRA